MPRDRRLTLLIGALLLALAFAVKSWYRSATVEELGFMLRPVSRLVEWGTGSASSFSPDLGFTFPSLHIRIDRSCSGVNFLIIAIAALTLLIIRRADGGCARPVLVLLALPLAYLVAVVANASRIICLAAAKPYGLFTAPRAHEAFGAFVFLAFLMAAVMMVHRALPRTAA